MKQKIKKILMCICIVITIIFLCIGIKFGFIISGLDPFGILIK